MVDIMYILEKSWLFMSIPAIKIFSSDYPGYIIFKHGGSGHTDPGSFAALTQFAHIFLGTKLFSPLFLQLRILNVFLTQFSHFSIVLEFLCDNFQLITWRCFSEVES